MNTHTPPLAWGRSAIALCVATLVNGAANAGCWHNEDVAHHARRLAQAFFPATQQQMPTIWTCSADQFPYRVGGTYSPGSHEIRIPEWQLQAGWPALRAVLVHELAHAEVWLKYGHRPEAQGHGREWMAIMMGVGEQAEALRMAREVGDMPGYVAALSQLGQSAALVGGNPHSPDNHACDERLALPPSSGLYQFRLASKQRVTLTVLGHPRIIRAWTVAPGLIQMNVSASPDGATSTICVS